MAMSPITEASNTLCRSVNRNSIASSPRFIDVAAAATSRPGRLASLLTLYRLLLRTQITVPRLLGIAGLGALSLVIGLFARWDADPDQVGT